MIESTEAGDEYNSKGGDSPEDKKSEGELKKERFQYDTVEETTV